MDVKADIVSEYSRDSDKYGNAINDDEAVAYEGRDERDIKYSETSSSVHNSGDTKGSRLETLVGIDRMGNEEGHKLHGIHPSSRSHTRCSPTVVFCRSRSQVQRAIEPSHARILFAYLQVDVHGDADSE